MKWSSAKSGDRRIIHRFLFLPTKPVNEREKRWLETSYIMQTYIATWWYNRNWATSEEYQEFKNHNRIPERFNRI